MKHILEIINLAGSARNFIGDQFSYFRKQGGYEMHLICSPDNVADSFAQKHNIHYFPVDIARTPNPKRDLIALWKIYQYIRRNKIDIVISHQEKSRLLGTLAAWFCRVPVRIIYAHGVLLDTMHGLKKFFFLIEGKIVSMMAHKIVCVSPSVMKRRAALGIDKPEKQVLIGNGTCNGVDTVDKFNPILVTNEKRFEIKERLGINENDFVVGFCGRLVRDKGVAELVEAVKILSKRFPEKSIKLLVIGSFEKRDALPQSTVEFLQKSPHVIFTGPIPYDDIQLYYTPMNVLILPSYREGFGLVTIEAGAMGIPAIVSRSTGCIDSIVEGKTGLFTDIDPNDIADKIEIFFDNNFARRLGDNACRYVKVFFEHRDVLRKTLEFINSTF